MNEETIDIPADAMKPEKPHPAAVLGALAGDQTITDVVVVAARADGSLTLHSTVKDLSLISYWMERQLAMIYAPNPMPPPEPSNEA